MLCGYGRKRALLLSAFVAAVTALFAQTPEDEDFRRIRIRDVSDDYMPHIESDSTIFYRAVQATEDIFDRVTDYDLSFVAFARRGERYFRTPTVLHGIPVRSEYRYMLDNLHFDSRRFSGLRSSETFIGGTNGFVEYYGDIYEPPLTGKAGVNFADKGYWAGLTASVSGSSRNGWSVSASLAARTGRDLHVKGVFTNAVEGGLRLSKHWNFRHRLTFAAMFSPSERGLRRASVGEAFTLTGDNLYNPSWGICNGKVRNANVRRTMIPSLTASFDSEITPRTQLKVSAGADVGVGKYSALEWFDAMTPVPDNYRYLPSGYDDTAVAEGVAGVWRTGDVKYTQIDWDELYRQNRMSADGSAIYAVSDRVERIADFNVRASAVTELGHGMTLGYGLRASYSDRRNWRQMRDLLGADHIVDIDLFLVDDATYGNKLQNDLRNPNRIIREGDRFSYDYSLTERYAGVFVMLSRQSDKSHLDFAAEIGDKTIFRNGFYEKELFAGSGSFGCSRKVRMMPYIVKAAYGYSFTPRHYLELCGSLSGETPDSEDLFLQVRYNNRVIDNPGLRRTGSVELNYTFLHSTIDLKASLFATLISNECEVSHYFDDLSGEYADMVVSGISRMNIGIEAAANIRISKHWSASAAVSSGRYRYFADPRVTLYADTDNRILVDDSAARMRDCRVGNAPQIAATAEVLYMNRGWGVRMSLNYAGLRYVEPAAMRRTDRVSHQGSVSEEMFLRFVTQERLPDAATVDAGVWRVFWVGRNYGSRSRIVVSLSSRNLIGSKNIIYNGRESSRIHRTRVAGSYLYSPFATTYLYAYPRTFRLSVTYRF